MSQFTVNAASSKIMTASGSITPCAGALVGFRVNSTSSGTITLLDGGAFGTAMSGTITPAIGYHAFPATFDNGLYVGISGTINVTFFFVALSAGGTAAATPTPTFEALFEDAGNGAVDTTLHIGTGSGTFTRASTALTKLSTGLWGEVASGVPRSCYLGADTAVGEYGGYFAEGAGTQLVTPTAAIRDMSGGDWVKVTITATKNATGIDGVANSATTLRAVSPNATILQTLVAAASSRTYSAFVRRKTGTGTITLRQGTATLDITALINSTTYTRVSLNDNELNVSFGFQIDTSGDEIEVDFNQFEAGTFATSPMASAGAARNADVLTYVYAGNANTATGSCYCEVSSSWSSGAANRTIVGFVSGSVYVIGSEGGVPTVIRTNDGTNGISKTGLTSMATAVRKRATSWGGTTSYITGDGAASASGNFDGSFGNTAIGIGNGATGAEQWYGTIKNVHIWQTQFSDSQLQAITA